MENSKIKDEAKKVTDALAGFSTFAESIMTGVVKDAPPEQREKMQKEVDKIRNGEFKEVQDKLKEVGVTLGNII